MDNKSHNEPQAKNYTLCSSQNSKPNSRRKEKSRATAFAQVLGIKYY